jgi:hypothetical protein
MLEREGLFLSDGTNDFIDEMIKCLSGRAIPSMLLCSRTVGFIGISIDVSGK